MDNGLKIGLASFASTMVLLAAPQIAHAETGHHGQPATRAEAETRVADRFTAMDADGDGRVTEAEANARFEARKADRQARMFDRLDADDDGMITAEEQAAARTHFRGRRGGSAGRPTMAEDRPMNERVTIEEMREQAEARGLELPTEGLERMQSRWSSADGDGDGAISRAEFDAAAQARSESRRERRADRRADRPGRFARMDADGDGALTPAELSERAMTRFDSADANGDGTLTAEERRAARQARRGGRSQQSNSN